MYVSNDHGPIAVDDLKPTFNKDFFDLKISEDTGADTPLPGK